MHETLESIQTRSKKLIDGNIKVYFALFSIAVAMFSKEAQIAAILIFSILSIHAVGKNFLKIIEVPIFFLITSLLVILFTIDGKTVYEIWGLEITDRSVDVCTSTLLRATATLFIVGYLVVTTTLPEFISAIKFLPDFIRELMMFSYRAIQILYDEVEKLDLSANSRLGFSNMKRRLKTSSLIAYSLFLKSMVRSRRFELAMVSRCYSGKFPSQYNMSATNRNTFLALILATFILTSAIYGFWI
ncbi:MAG: cobalt ECF transporter T component CbiQ [Archaeoglobaceae archaeon]